MIKKDKIQFAFILGLLVTSSLISQQEAFAQKCKKMEISPIQPPIEIQFAEGSTNKDTAFNDILPFTNLDISSTILGVCTSKNNSGRILNINPDGSLELSNSNASTDVVDGSNQGAIRGACTFNQAGSQFFLTGISQPQFGFDCIYPYDTTSSKPAGFLRVKNKNENNLFIPSDLATAITVTPNDQYLLYLQANTSENKLSSLHSVKINPDMTLSQDSTGTGLAKAISAGNYLEFAEGENKDSQFVLGVFSDLEQDKSGSGKGFAIFKIDQKNNGRISVIAEFKKGNLSLPFPESLNTQFFTGISGLKLVKKEQAYYLFVSYFETNPNSEFGNFSYITKLALFRIDLQQNSASLTQVGKELTTVFKMQPCNSQNLHGISGVLSVVGDTVYLADNSNNNSENFFATYNINWDKVLNAGAGKDTKIFRLASKPIRTNTNNGERNTSIAVSSHGGFAYIATTANSGSPNPKIFSYLLKNTDLKCSALKQSLVKTGVCRGREFEDINDEIEDDEEKDISLTLDKDPSSAGGDGLLIPDKDSSSDVGNALNPDAQNTISKNIPAIQDTALKDTSVQPAAPTGIQANVQNTNPTIALNNPSNANNLNVQNTNPEIALNNPSNANNLNVQNNNNGLIGANLQPLPSNPINFAPPSYNNKIGYNSGRPPEFGSSPKPKYKAVPKSTSKANSILAYDDLIKQKKNKLSWKEKSIESNLPTPDQDINPFPNELAVNIPANAKSKNTKTNNNSMLDLKTLNLSGTDQLIVSPKIPNVSYILEKLKEAEVVEEKPVQKPSALLNLNSTMSLTVEESKPVEQPKKIIKPAVVTEIFGVIKGGVVGLTIGLNPKIVLKSKDLPNITYAFLDSKKQITEIKEASTKLMANKLAVTITFPDSISTGSGTLITLLKNKKGKQDVLSKGPVTIYKSYDFDNITEGNMSVSGPPTITNISAKITGPSPNGGEIIRLKIQGNNFASKQIYINGKPLSAVKVATIITFSDNSDIEILRSRVLDQGKQMLVVLRYKGKDLTSKSFTLSTPKGNFFSEKLNYKLVESRPVEPLDNLDKEIKKEKDNSEIKVSS